MAHNYDKHDIFPILTLIGEEKDLFWGPGKINRMKWYSILKMITKMRIGVLPWFKDDRSFATYVNNLNRDIDEKKEYLEPPPLSKKARKKHVIQEDPYVCAPGWGRLKVRLLFDEWQKRGWGNPPTEILISINKGTFREKVLGVKGNKRKGIEAIEGIKGIGPKLVVSMEEMFLDEYNRGLCPKSAKNR
jgi:hypothetical protein